MDIVLKRLFFCLFLFFCLKASAQETVPHPSELKPGWWKYYETDPALLKSRIENTEAFFVSLRSSSSLASSQDADNLMREIVSNLYTYYNLRNDVSRGAPTGYQFTGSNDLTGLLQLFTTVYEAELVEADYEREVQFGKREIENNKRLLNDVLSGYNNTVDDSSRRFLLGLEIINKRSQIEVNLLQLKGLKDKLHWQQVYLSDIMLEQEKLIDTLDFSNVVADADSRISQLQAQIDQARQKRLETKAQFLQFSQSTPEIVLDYYDQVLIYYKTLEALQRIEQLNYLIVKKMALFSVGQLGAGEFKEELKALAHKKEDIISERAIWISSTQKDLSRSAEILSRHQQYSDGEGFSKLLEESQKTFILLNDLQYQIYINEELNHLATDKLKRSYGGVIYTWLQLKDFLSEDLWEGKNIIHKSLFTVGEAPITIFLILKFLLFLTVFYLLAKFLKFYISHIGEKQKKLQPAAIYAVSNILYYILIILGIFIAFTSVGIDFTAFAFIAGALSVGIGFGLQSIFNNFVSGLILLLEKNIRKGDYIELDTGERGIVKDIKVRSTRLTTYDGIDILVPNAEFIAKKCINWTLKDPTRRLRVPFCVSYGTDKEFLKKIIIEAALKVPMTINDEQKSPQLWLMKFGESSLDFELVVWVNERIPTKRDMATHAYYMWTIHTALIENGLKIPFPQRDIHIIEEDK